MKPSVFLLLFFIIGHVFAQKNAPDKIDHIQSLIPTHLDSALVLSQELMGSEVDSLVIKTHYLAALIYYYKGQNFLSNQYFEKFQIVILAGKKTFDQDLKILLMKLIYYFRKKKQEIVKHDNFLNREIHHIISNIKFNKLKSNYFAFLMMNLFTVSVFSVPVSPNVIHDMLLQARKYIPARVSEADSLATACLDMSLKRQNDSLSARSYYLLGLTNYFKSNYLKSSVYYKKALATAYATNNFEFAERCYNNLGINYEIDANYQEATAAYLQSLKLAGELGDSLSMFQTYINLGFLYSRIRDFSSSESYLLAGLDFFIRANDTYNQALCHQNLGILYNDMGMKAKALLHYENAVERYRILGDTKGILQNKINEINTLIDIKRFDSIPGMLQQTMQMARQAGDPFLEALVYNLYGRYYLDVKDFKAALTSLTKAESTFLELGARGKVRYIYLLLIDLYRQTGQDSLFKEALEKYDQITQQIFDEETAAKIADYNAIYESEKKAAQIVFLDQQLRQRENILTLWVSISLLLMASVITISILYLNYRRRQKSLFERNEEIMAIMDQNEGVVNHETEMRQAPHEHLKELKLFKEIKEIVITKKLWEDPGLKVADLSSLLFTNDKYISSAIAVGNKSNFNHFINTYRINAAKKLLANESYDRLTYVQIADKVGFSNEYTFQKKFKELTGLTPHTYKKMGKDR